MSDNKTDVLIVTADSGLADAVMRACPRGCSALRTDAGGAAASRLPSADQIWLDLDGLSMLPSMINFTRRVYFYSSAPPAAERLPHGLFVRKPCSGHVLKVLWDGVSQPLMAPVANSDPAVAAGLPNWIAEFHLLDVRQLCHQFAAQLPQRLGFREISVYLFDSTKNCLTLAEANVPRPVDLTVRVNEDVDSLLGYVVRSGVPLLVPNLAALCRKRGFALPKLLDGQPDRAALLFPLAHDTDIHGLIVLSDAAPASPPSAVPPTEVLAFLGRSLRYAMQFEQAAEEARIDALTGLFNYRWMMESLGREIRRAERFAQHLSVLMIDLDGFKPINDRHGHQAGDDVLRHVAGRIRLMLRQIDAAARVGGDEFVVLLPGTDRSGAEHVAAKIRQAVEECEPVIDGQVLPVQVSVGIACWQRDWDAYQLLDAADQAMYAIKREQHAKRFASLTLDRLIPIEPK